jgi:hypothetical protein
LAEINASAARIHFDEVLPSGKRDGPHPLADVRVLAQQPEPARVQSERGVRKNGWVGGQPIGQHTARIIDGQRAPVLNGDMVGENDAVLTDIDRTSRDGQAIEKAIGTGVAAHDIGEGHIARTNLGHLVRHRGIVRSDRAADSGTAKGEDDAGSPGRYRSSAGSNRRRSYNSSGGWNRRR